MKALVFTKWVAERTLDLLGIRVDRCPRMDNRLFHMTPKFGNHQRLIVINFANTALYVKLNYAKRDLSWEQYYYTAVNDHLPVGDQAIPPWVEVIRHIDFDQGLSYYPRFIDTQYGEYPDGQLPDQIRARMGGQVYVWTRRRAEGHPSPRTCIPLEIMKLSLPAR